MNQQEKQELKTKLRQIAKPTTVVALLCFLALAVLKFFGPCAGIFAAAVITTSLMVHSLLDREYRRGIMESYIRVYTIIGFVLFFIILWLFVYVVCVEID